MWDEYLNTRFLSLPLRSGLHDGAGGDGVHHLVRVRRQVQPA